MSGTHVTLVAALALALILSSSRGGGGASVVERFSGGGAGYAARKSEEGEPVLFGEQRVLKEKQRAIDALDASWRSAFERKMKACMGAYVRALSRRSERAARDHYAERGSVRESFEELQQLSLDPLRYGAKQVAEMFAACDVALRGLFGDQVDVWATTPV